MQNDCREDNEESDIFRFISELRQEALYISSEKRLLQELNERVGNKTDEILQSIWVTTRQRLFVLPQREFNLQNIHGIISLGSTQFVEAKHVVGFQNAGKIGALLQILRTQPEQLAQWLIIGEQLNDEQTHLSIMQSIVSGLYASVVFPKDINYMLVLLNELAKYQLSRNENPQRALKQRSNSFGCLYSMFHEVLLSAKYFLSGALEVPIMKLLTIDFYLDIDPDKSVMRFQQNSNISTLFKDPLEYRQTVTQRLAEVTNLFVSSIKDNSLSFPKPLSWLVFQISKFISDAFTEKEVNAVLTELVFTMFICPAIVNPLQFGICDAQITSVSRNNLMQAAQIIQSLALAKFESPVPKVMDLYNLINKNSVVQILDDIFSEIKYKSTPPLDVAPFMSREVALFTEQEIRLLTTFLQRVSTEIIQNQMNKENTILTDSIVDKISALCLDPVENEVSRPNSHSESNGKKGSLLYSVTRTNTKLPEEAKTTNNVVLIFPIRTNHIEPIGMLPEGSFIEKTLCISNSYDEEVEIHKEQKSNDNNERNKVNNYNYQDEGSIGNTSDNLEAISEGASNHSVASSLEMENEDQNDNYSDMMSANVSGRGTPNISGRDTPSSQVNENEERVSSEIRQADNSRQPQQVQLSTQIRSEIDDKFCKFEIKLLGPGRDETTSLISETWSTDVLASDNENVDTVESRSEQQSSCSIIDAPIVEVPNNHMLDISETQSESAWSTDVMASDNERLIEIDNDETASIAQSDDTNSIAPSDDTRSETDENLGVGSRRLSSSSNSFMNQSNVSTHYQDMRRLENRFEQSTNIKIFSMEKNSRKDSNANVISKSSHSSIRNSSSFSEQGSEEKTTHSCVNTFMSSIVETPSNKDKDVLDRNTFRKVHSVESDSNEMCAAYVKRTKNKYQDGPNDILSSNCSLTSSSSGSSSNSLESKTINDTLEKWENKHWLNSSQSSINVTSTPSERSASELSVSTVTTLISPVNMASKKLVTPNYSKSFSSTGAIPKSISFDISADKSEKFSDEDHRSKRASFFGKLKIGFRNKRVKSLMNSDDAKMENEDECHLNRRNMKFLASQMKNSNSMGNVVSDTSDQILEKYRTKLFQGNNSNKMDKESPKPSRIKHMNDSNAASKHGCNTLKDIKNKLRIILSHSIVQLPADIKISGVRVQNKLETILLIELGKSRKLKQWSNVARITETLRCVQLLNEKSCIKLVHSMKEDIVKRLTYTQYLTSSRRDLLLSEAHLDGLQEQIHFEKNQCEEYLAILCVDDFLGHKEAAMNSFCNEFKQLSLSDEKCDILENFYAQLYSDMKRNIIWNELLEDRKDTIEMALQRHIISKVYENALYPNGDGDRDRDSVLNEHIGKLSSIITPEHKYLMIKKSFLRECPWLPAQDALNVMNAFRTPRDKVKCVVHCAKCIMDLLSMAQNGSTTADDFTPVLVFVIVKSNPPNLLSTLQFVNSFYQDQLCGEEQYWWTQFCAAVEFIKTMDYSD